MKKTTSIIFVALLGALGLAALAQARPPMPPPLQPANQEVYDFTESLNDPNDPAYRNRPEDADYPPLPVYGEEQEPADEPGIVPDAIPNTDSGGPGAFPITMVVLVLGISAAGAYYWYKTRKER